MCSPAATTPLSAIGVYVAGEATLSGCLWPLPGTPMSGVAGGRASWEFANTVAKVGPTGPCGPTRPGAAFLISSLAMFRVCFFSFAEHADRGYAGHNSQGPDVLAGGRGRDTIFSGKGKDSVFAVDHKRDRIQCGGGRDHTVADPGDKLKRCETVTRTGHRFSDPVVIEPFQ